MIDPKAVERMADFFDVRSEGYEAHMERSVASFAGFYHAVASPIPATKEALRILDLGSGTGLELDAIFGRAPNAAITAIDVSAGMLERLRAKYAARAERLYLVRGSYLELPFGTARYDYAVAVMTLHHLLPSTKRELYGKLRRALKGGGATIEADWTVSPAEEERYLASYNARVAELEPSRAGAYHIDIPMSLTTAKDLLRQAGFSTVEVIWEADGNSVYVARC